MSRNLTAAQVEMLQLEGAKLKALVKIDNSPDFIWRYCTGSVAVNYDEDGLGLSTESYVPRGISLAASSSGNVQGTHMTISIDNRDDKSGDFKLTGINGADVTVVLMTTIDDIPQEPIVLEVGDVNRCKISEDLTIDVVPINKGLKLSGLLRCSRMCPYQFGGDLCGLSIGPTDTCRRTYVDCQFWGNQQRFGGFIWALDSGESIMVQQPVPVKPPSDSNSGDGFQECHSGRFVTLIRRDGSHERVEMRCDIDVMNQGGDHTDGYYTDPWELQIPYDPETEM